MTETTTETPIEPNPKLFDFLGTLKKLRMSPARISVRDQGRMSFNWFVDDDDNRYVEAASSVGNEDFLLICREGHKVEAIVSGDVCKMVEWISDHIMALGFRSLSRGARETAGDLTIQFRVFILEACNGPTPYSTERLLRQPMIGERLTCHKPDGTFDREVIVARVQGSTVYALPI